MKYKIIKGTALFAKLIELNEKLEAARAKIREHVSSIGGEEFATSGSHHLLKLDAVQFAEKPEGWRSVGQSWQRLYVPKANNKKAWAAINELPFVDSEELNTLVGYDQFVGRDLAIAHRPGVHFGTDEVLIEVAEEMEWYKPVPDMVEIKVTEFNTLLEAIKGAEA